jgi:tetratricopeptide (TPR) repeat protein
LRKPFATGGRQADSRVRISAQLVDATTGHHVWAERYDRPLQDIFALQDEIVQKIVTTLQLQITLLEQGYLARKRTDNLEAYDYFLRGAEYCCRGMKETNAYARQMWEKATELDPAYAEAYAWLGRSYLMEWIFQWTEDPQVLEQAVTLAQKAVALDDSLPAAHLSLSQVYLWKKLHEQAIAEAEWAVALDPNDADSSEQLGLTLSFAGRPEDALGLIEKAVRSNPRAAYSLNSLGAVYYLTGWVEEAIVALKRCLARYPNFLYARLNLAAIYSELGRQEEAQTEAAAVLRLNPNFSVEKFGQIFPAKDSAVLERYLAGLRRAGLK